MLSEALYLLFIYSKVVLINQYFKCQNRQNKPFVLSKQSKLIFIGTTKKRTKISPFFVD